MKSNSILNRFIVLGKNNFYTSVVLKMLIFLNYEWVYLVCQCNIKYALFPLVHLNYLIVSISVADRSVDAPIEFGVTLFIVQIFFSLRPSIPCFVTFVSNLYFLLFYIITS